MLLDALLNIVSIYLKIRWQTTFILSVGDAAFPDALLVDVLTKIDGNWSKAPEEDEFPYL